MMNETECSKELIRVSVMTDKLVHKADNKISRLHEIIESHIYGRPVNKLTRDIEKVPSPENIIDKVIEDLRSVDNKFDDLDNLFTKLEAELKKL